MNSSCHHLHRTASLLSTCYSVKFSFVRTGFFPIGRFRSRTVRQTAAKNAFSVNTTTGQLALDAITAAVFFHLETPMLLPPAVLQLIFLKVDTDIEVVVHAVGFVRLKPLGEVALQLLQLLRGQKVGLGKHHLKGKRPHVTFFTSAWWGWEKWSSLPFVFYFFYI